MSRGICAMLASRLRSSSIQEKYALKNTLATGDVKYYVINMIMQAVRYPNNGDAPLLCPRIPRKRTSWHENIDLSGSAQYNRFMETGFH